MINTLAVAILVPHAHGDLQQRNLLRYIVETCGQIAISWQFSSGKHSKQPCFLTTHTSTHTHTNKYIDGLKRLTLPCAQAHRVISNFAVTTSLHRITTSNQTGSHQSGRCLARMTSSNIHKFSRELPYVTRPGLALHTTVLGKEDVRLLFSRPNTQVRTRKGRCQTAFLKTKHSSP